MRQLLFWIGGAINKSSEIAHEIWEMLSGIPQILFDMDAFTLALRRILYEISSTSDRFSLDSSKIYPIPIIITEFSTAIS